MKTILGLFVAGLLATAAQAQSLLLSDFSSSHFVVDSYIVASEGPWSDATASYGATSFSIGDFGNGTPSGHYGNGFMQYLGDTPQDWTAFSSLELTGTTLASNATATLGFYMEDVAGESSLTTFALSDFVNGATVLISLNKVGIDMGNIQFWGFQVMDFNSSAPEFGFEFDNALVTAASAVPEPSTYALMFGGVALFGAVLRRRRNVRGQEK
jgi:hypothetical protein